MKKAIRSSFDRSSDAAVQERAQGAQRAESLAALAPPRLVWIEKALDFRIPSQESPSYTGQVLSALRHQFGGHDVKAKT